ncbi:MAG: RNase adapter RapZ [Thermoanaerobacterales bacterium]|nr:RNase adapter RapZ [Thermoanaerobacterales bacterium]
MTSPRLVIITGLSGAGKTLAVRSLEDLGFFCVDNLPPQLIPKFAELCAQTAGKINRVALVIDVRGGEFFRDLVEVLKDLKQQGVPYTILFLEASNEALVRRFKESRRPHPLSPSGEIVEGITAERAQLRELRGLAHKIIDTSNMTVNQLKLEIANLYGDTADQERLAITVVSFGYKHGIPLDADLVIDVRFLPNPHYIAELRPLTGHDPRVRDYVFGFDITREFLERMVDMLEFLIPHYVREGKATLTVAVGCTGGMHRSVSLVNRLGELLRAHGHRVAVRHRDLNRE